MVSQEDVSNLSTMRQRAFIPTNELTKEQIDKLNNITVHAWQYKL
jgi:hypothetical protein